MSWNGSKLSLALVSLLCLAAFSFSPIVNRPSLTSPPQLSERRAAPVLIAGQAAGLAAGFRTANVVPTQDLLNSRHAAVAAKISGDYGKLPLSFEANQGQTDPRVKFVSRSPGYSLFLTNDEAVFSLRVGKTKARADSRHSGPTQPSGLPNKQTLVRMKLVNSNRSAKVTGENQLQGKSNYFVGNDPEKWRSNIPNYGRVKYEDVYPGVDLVYYGKQRQLEYDFVVAPGADPHRIQFNVAGAKRMLRDENGDLVSQLAEGELRWHRPVVYQEEGGKRRDIEAHYVISPGRQVGFAVGAYDPRKPLVIDPILYLVYSTYLGDGAQAYGNGIAVDSAGNAYVVGSIYTGGFPTVNAIQPVYGGGEDAFVTKFNASGSALVYSTYLGGSGAEFGNGIAVDSSGNVYVTGFTGSTNFPTMNPLQPALAGGLNAFVSKIDPTGSALVYSTYLGGSDLDFGNGIAVDSSGDAVIVGETLSTNFPTMNAFQSAYGGPIYGAGKPQYWGDAFVTKINASGSALVYSTYLGGSTYDAGQGVAVDGLGNALVTGWTSSTNFPTMNALQPKFGGGGECSVGAGCFFGDAFVAKISPSGALVYSTYLGGSGADEGFAIAADNSGNAYITGLTLSGDFAITAGAFQPTCTNCGSGSPFVTKLNPSGSALVYSTYLGIAGQSQGIVVDSAGCAYVAGWTESPSFPTMNAFQPTLAGGGDAFVSKFNPSGSALLYSTFLGGSIDTTNNNQPGYSQAFGIAIDSSGNLYVTGVTQSSDFPTRNPVQPVYGGSGNAFVTKLSLASLSVSGSPQQPLTINGSGDYVAKVTVTNNSNVTLGTVQVTTAGTRLGSGAPFVVPAAITNLAPGANAVVTLTFPPSAVSPGATTAPLKVSGTYSAPAVPLNGNWALSFRSVTL